MRLSLISILVFSINLAYAQDDPMGPSGDHARGSAADSPLQSLSTYVRAPSGSREALERLEEIDSKGLITSKTNFAELVRLTQSTKQKNERVILLRILARFYDRDTVNPDNEEIKSILLGAANLNDSEVARAGLIAYTRLGYLEDTETILDQQRKRGFISDDDQFGELAHALPFAPEGEQIRLIEKISKSKNAYAIDIIAGKVKSEESRQHIRGDVKRALQALLEDNQPKFSLAIGEFSLTEAVVYSDWLHSLASLTSENTRVTYDEIILGHLGNVTANPKKLLSYFLFREGKAAGKRIGKKRMVNIAERAKRFAAELPYPQNQDVQTLAAELNTFVNSIQ